VSVALLAWVTGQPARGGNRPRLLVLVVPALVMALLFAMSPLASPDAATPGLLNELLHVKRWRLALLPDVVLGYDSRVDVPTAMLFAAWVVAALATARVRIAVLMLPGIAGLLLLYLVVPEGWNTTWYIPQRLPVVIFLLCIASFDVEVRSRRELIASYIAMLLVVCARTGSAAAAWHEIDQERRPFVAVLSRLSPDSTIVDSHQAAGDILVDLRFPFMGMTAIATITGGAFSPNIFTNPSQNLLRLKPAYEELARHAAGDNRVDLHEEPLASADYGRPDVLAYYDYILVDRPELYQKPVPAGLEPIVQAPGAILYRVLHGRIASP
jgi:hypothetical protein